MYSHLTKEELLVTLRKSQDRVAELIEQSRSYKTKIEILEKKSIEFETKARHLDALIKPIQENEMVRSSWDRFLMSLRLAGYDESK